MTTHLYNEMCRVYRDYIPLDSIYRETRRAVFNVMKDMTSGILSTAGFVDAHYCHVVITNKESLTKMLTEEQNPFKREKLANAIANLDAPVVAEMIDSWNKEQQNITGLVTAVAAVAANAITTAEVSEVTSATSHCI